MKELTKVEETEENEGTESIDKEQFNGKEIKIQVNKNKRILEHLTKFSQDIDDIKDKEGIIITR